MSSQLRISADTSEVKKSIVGLGKDLSNIKGSKVSIFSAADRKFIKEEFKKEIVLMKARLVENRKEISKMVEEQKKLTEGSKEELEMRKKILEAYKVQAKLGKDLAQTQKIAKEGPGGGGMLGSIMSGLPKLLGGIALAAGAFALAKGYEATGQYVAGTGNRNKLKGLGVSDENFGSPQDLARVGLTEQDMIQRRIDSTAALGREGGSQANEMKRAGFERAFGLDGGTMSNIAAQLRPSMGASGAVDTQMKLQASVLAAGIEDAIGPYLEAATSLLTKINESGDAQTDEITNLLAVMTKDGARTPEMIAKTFAGINDSVKGATGEQSAFLQTAFARSGIGGGTIGGTKFAMSSGGIMGLNEKELAKRGYNPELLKNFKDSGMFKGVQERTGSIMNLMRESGGLGAGEKVSDITDANRAIGMGNFANSIFGTKGNQGLDALMMLEDVQSGKMKPEEFDRKIQEMKEGKDPTVERLDKINSSLSGQTQLLDNINNNLMEALGKEGVQVRNTAKGIENEGIVGAKNVAGAVNSTGVVQGTGNAITRGAKYINSGGLGSDIYDWVNRPESKTVRPSSFNQAPGDNPAPSADAIGKAVGKALKESPIVNKINNSNRIIMPDGKVTERTNK